MGCRESRTVSVLNFGGRLEKRSLLDVIDIPAISIDRSVFGNLDGHSAEETMSEASA